VTVTMSERRADRSANRKSRSMTAVYGRPMPRAISLSFNTIG
jgi:hypothetical protein